MTRKRLNRSKIHSLLQESRAVAVSEAVARETFSLYARFLEICFHKHADSSLGNAPSVSAHKKRLVSHSPPDEFLEALRETRVERKRLFPSALSFHEHGFLHESDIAHGEVCQLGESDARLDEYPRYEFIPRMKSGGVFLEGIKKSFRFFFTQSAYFFLRYLWRRDAVHGIGRNDALVLQEGEETFERGLLSPSGNRLVSFFRNGKQEAPHVAPGGVCKRRAFGVLPEFEDVPPVDRDRVFGESPLNTKVLQIGAKVGFFFLHRAEVEDTLPSRHTKSREPFSAEISRGMR